jgi:hypothetical protein
MPITRTPIVDDNGTGTTGTVIDNAWKQQLYDQIDGLAGAALVWTAYTPVWSSYSAPNPVLGNGTIAGSYATINGLTYFQVRLTMGSTTTYGTATNWTLSLPSAIVNFTFLASGRAVDASTGASFLIGHGVGGTTSSNFIPIAPTSSIGASYPFTWAVGDILEINGVYRSA